MGRPLQAQFIGDTGWTTGTISQGFDTSQFTELHVVFMSSGSGAPTSVGIGWTVAEPFQLGLAAPTGSYGSLAVPAAGGIKDYYIGTPLSGANVLPFMVSTVTTVQASGAFNGSVRAVLEGR